MKTFPSDTFQYSPATRVVATASSGFKADYYTDGSNDNVEIQAAINAVSVSGKGIVFIKEGTYTIGSNILLASNVVVKGAGWNTILMLGNNVNDTVLQNLTAIHPATNIHILNLAIDMNGANNTTINKGGIKLESSSNCLVDRVKISNFKHLQGQGNTAIGMEDMTNTIISNCYLYNTDDYGIAADGMNQCKIINNYIQNVAGHGIGMEQGTIGSPTERNTGTIVSGNTIFWDANETLTQQDGIKIGRIDYCNISNNIVYCTNKNGYSGIHNVVETANYQNGNTISNNTIYGFRLGVVSLGGLHDSITDNTISLPDLQTLGPTGIQCGASQVSPITIGEEIQITGNTIIYEPNTTLNAGGAGIFITDNLDFINISGNTIFNASYTGIRINSGCNFINISENIIRDSMRASITLGLGGSLGCSYCNISGNILSGSSRTGNGLYSEIELIGATIYSNINDNNILTPNTNKILYGINEISSTTGQGLYENNIIQSTSSGTGINLQANSSIVRDNIGYITANSGTATVASGTTSTVISHGLNRTPTSKDISLTPTNNLGNATKFWISTVTATQFTVNVNADPGVTTATFVWKVNIL